MGEHTILFSGEMVKAILDGRKTQTRRLIVAVRGLGRVTEFGPSDTPGYDWIMRDRRMLWNDLRAADLLARCPYGVPGARLWVRETWYSSPDGTELLGFKADGDFPHGQPYRVRPSIFMPREASRLTLEVVSVRPERVQDISEEDAIAEGMEKYDGVCGTNPDGSYRTGYTTHGIGSFPTALEAYRVAWDIINGKRAPWEENQWVWRIEFARLLDAREWTEVPR